MNKALNWLKDKMRLIESKNYSKFKNSASKIYKNPIITTQLK